jgi:hypothetical protein
MLMVSDGVMSDAWSDVCQLSMVNTKATTNQIEQN